MINFLRFAISILKWVQYCCDVKNSKETLLNSDSWDAENAKESIFKTGITEDEKLKIQRYDLLRVQSVSVSEIRGAVQG